MVAAAIEFDAEIAGAARDIQHTRTGFDRERVDRDPSPVRVHPEGEDAVQRVVPRRDAIEHLLDDA